VSKTAANKIHRSFTDLNKISQTSLQSTWVYNYEGTNQLTESGSKAVVESALALLMCLWLLKSATTSHFHTNPYKQFPPQMNFTQKSFSENMTSSQEGGGGGGE
jgi:hypothetical protein